MNIIREETKTRSAINSQLMTQHFKTYSDEQQIIQVETYNQEVPFYEFVRSQQ